MTDEKRESPANVLSMSSILQNAHSPDGYIDKNPARGVKVPKPESEEPKREPDPFTWEDRATLESIFQEHYPRYYPLVLTGFRTGLRLGELLGHKDIKMTMRYAHLIPDQKRTAVHSLDSSFRGSRPEPDQE